MAIRRESESNLAVAEQAAVESETETTDEFSGLSEEARINTARRYGMPDDSTWKQISMVGYEINRRRYAENLGLDPNTSMDDIKTKGPEIYRQERAIEENLHHDATMDEIRDAKWDRLGLKPKEDSAETPEDIIEPKAA